MAGLKRLLRAHYIAVILAVLASVIVAFPQVYFRIDHRNDGLYQGIELLPDSPWSARVREVQDGHPTLGSIYFKEGKSDPYLFQPLGSMVVGYMGEALSLDINDTILLSRFLLTAVAFLLIYSFVFLLSRDKLVAIASAAMLLLAESIMSYYGLSEILHGRSPDDFLRIARPVYPVLIYISLFSFLSSFWLFLEKRSWFRGGVSAALLGLNFYTYFYSWTYLYALGAVYFVFLLIRKKWHEAIAVAGVYLAALIAAIPWALNIHRASLYPEYAQTAARFGVIATHMPLFVGFVVVASLAAFLLWFPRADRLKYFFGLSLMLTPLLTLNQQILTGKVLQSAHYHWFFHKPMAAIFILFIVSYLLSRLNWPVLRKTLFVLIILGSFASGAFVQLYSYAHGTRDGGGVALARQRYGSPMEWLQKNAEKEQVVLSNDEISHLVTIYTPLNVFFHRADMYALSATEARLRDVIFTFYRLRGVGATNVHDVFYDERRDISANLYGMHYREQSGSYEAIPDAKMDEIVALYKETLSTPRATWLSNALSKYEVNYVVWDSKADPTWHLEQYGFLKRAATFGDISIYRFAK